MIFADETGWFSIINDSSWFPSVLAYLEKLINTLMPLRSAAV